MAKEPNDHYSEEESEKRLAAALRGARITGHKPMSGVPKKGSPSAEQQDEKKPSK